MTTAGAVAALLALSTPAVEDPASELPKLVVLDLVCEGGIDAGVVRLLNELVLTEFERTGQYQVIGGSDIQTLLAGEAQKQAIGCTDAACLAEVGGALGGDLLASANIGAIGSHYLLNLKILDVHTTKVAQRWSEQIDRDDDKLMSAIRRSIASMSAAMVREAESAGAGTSIESTGSLTPSTSAERVGWLGITRWGALGLTAALGASAGVLGYLANRDASRARDEYRGTPEWEKLKEAAEGKAVATDVLLGVTAAGAIGTAVLFLVVGDGGQSANAATVTVSPQGAAVSLSLQLP